MDRFLDWLTGLPKAVLAIFALVVFGLLGFAVYAFAFKDKVQTQEPEQQKVLLEMPSASIDDEQATRVDTYKRDNFRSATSASDFWDQLDGNSGGLVVNAGDDQATAVSQQTGTRVEPGRDVYLDPSIYSDIEIYQIRQGSRTKAEIDAEHAERARKEAEERAAEAASANTNKPVNSDSLYFARMEKAYELAMKYSSNPESESEETDTEEEQPDRIEIPEPSYIPENALSNDGLISSLEQESVGTVYHDGEITIRPVKATFLKTEKVIGGQRVIMRLKEDLHLKDGIVIPANTHVTGICDVGERLNIAISTINYGGRIYRTDMSVYDSDGTEGIYCPVIEQKKGKKAAGRIAGQAATGVASTAATLFTGNPFVGRAASSSIQELSRITLSNGSVAVNVVSEYEFYIFENIKKKKK